MAYFLHITLSHRLTGIARNDDVFLRHMMPLQAAIDAIFAATAFAAGLRRRARWPAAAALMPHDITRAVADSRRHADSATPLAVYQRVSAAIFAALTELLQMPPPLYLPPDAFDADFRHIAPLSFVFFTFAAFSISSPEIRDTTRRLSTPRLRQRHYASDTSRLPPSAFTITRRHCRRRHQMFTLLSADDARGRFRFFAFSGQSAAR